MGRHILHMRYPLGTYMKELIKPSFQAKQAHIGCFSFETYTESSSKHKNKSHT